MDIGLDIQCDILWDIPLDNLVAYLMERRWNGGVANGTVVEGCCWKWNGGGTVDVKKTTLPRLSKRTYSTTASV